MKKLSKVLCCVYGFLFLCLIFGCLDGRPSSWNVNDENWEIWAEGTIVSIIDIEPPGCSRGVNCDSHDPIKQITFNDGSVIDIGAIRDKGIIKEGQVGKLYKNNRGSTDQYSWFQWVLTDDVKETTRIRASRPDTKSIAEKPVESTFNVNETDWVKRSHKNPERNTPVLIKFKDGTLSVGYINNINEWKLSINKKEKDGGETIPTWEIVLWKNLDTD